MAVSTLAGDDVFPGTGVTVATVRFGPVDIAFDDDEVLAPRPWTIEQSRWAIELDRAGVLPTGPVLELCCGAGQIGLVVGVQSGRPIVQVDDDDEACAFARRNADDAGAAAEVRCAAVDAGVLGGERFALVLADPPYVPTGQTERFPDDPGHAIDGGADGLAVARRCVAVARAALEVGGVVLVQTGGEEQARVLAAEAPFEVHDIRSYGPDRAILLLADAPVRETANRHAVDREE